MGTFGELVGPNFRLVKDNLLGAAWEIKKNYAYGASAP